MRAYLTAEQAAEEFGCSTKHIRILMKEMRKYIPERYGKLTLFGEGRSVAVRTVCLMDYATHRKLIQSGDGDLLKFDAVESERELGINDGYEDSGVGFGDRKCVIREFERGARRISDL